MYAGTLDMFHLPTRDKSDREGFVLNRSAGTASFSSVFFFFSPKRPVKYGLGDRGEVTVQPWTAFLYVGSPQHSTTVESR